jgi:hypothetical protein
MEMIRRLTEHLDELVGPRTREMVLEASESITCGSSPEEVAAYFKGVMDRLDAWVDEETRREVMQRCSCPYPRERIEELKAKYRELQDIDQLVPLMHAGMGQCSMPVKRGNTVYITKAPYNPQGYSAARSQQERRRYYCHCPCICATSEPIRSWCFCGAGWYKQLWEGVLERPVEVEILQTVARGDPCCTFAIHLPPETSPSA